MNIGATSNGVDTRLESKVADLERRLRFLEKAEPGPTTDYKQLRRAYIGTQITEGVITVGGGGLGATAIIRLQDTGANIIGWIGSDVDVNQVLHTGAWIRDLVVSGVDELSGAAVGGWTSFVPTVESTASAVYTDLTTLDIITLNISIATKVSIRYQAQLANAGGAPINMYSILNSQNPITQLMGGDIVGTDAINTVAAGGFDTQDLQYTATLALLQTPITQYIIKIRHKVSAGTGTWSNRLLAIVPSS